MVDSRTPTMNQTVTSTWSPMVSHPEEDYASFLEFDDLQLNFPPFDPDPPATATGHHEPVDHPILHIPTSMPDMHDIHRSAESLLDLSIQAQLYHHHHQQHQQHQQQQYEHQVHGQYMQHGMIPLTPNSVEMHGGQLQPYGPVDPHARAAYEQYAKKRMNQVSGRGGGPIVTTAAPLTPCARCPLRPWYRRP